MSSSGNGRLSDPFKERRATREEHLDASESLRASADASLVVNDFVIASEAYWGAVAHILQAIAERNGLRHWSNRDFGEIVDWLIGETGDSQLLFSFARVYMLHRNFYRIVLDEHEVRAHARYAIDLADRIRGFAGP